MKKKSINDILTKDASVEEVGTLLSGITAQLRKNLRLLLMLPLTLGLLGFLVGLFVLDTKRRAVYIIAAEEETTSAMEGLMAQFGIEIGGANPGGVFRGESLAHLFTTRTMIEKALLKKIPYHGDSIISAELFFRNSRISNRNIFDNVEFNTDRSKHDILTDSALYLTYRYVNNEVLDVVIPHKRMGFIYVKCVHADPKLAVEFSKLLIGTVTDFYVNSITTKARQNLDLLQAEADSVRALINNNLSITAMEHDLNINPLWQSMRIDHNRAMIDLQVAVTLFGEIVKNLKLAEIALRRQTPFITIIEKPRFPLETVGITDIQLGASFFLLGLLIVLYISVRQYNKKQMSAQ
ncbi:MAG TPA: hypothetical protein VLH16_04780 [Bacteroidales bacterium]|nr:hypothetical protein [Bacteroidales bacterium]